eukprot:2703061-Pyramimonas_sp.AAC.1
MGTCVGKRGDAIRASSGMHGIPLRHDLASHSPSSGDCAPGGLQGPRGELCGALVAFRGFPAE